MTKREIIKDIEKTCITENGYLKRIDNELGNIRIKNIESELVSIIVYFSGRTSFRIFNQIDKDTIKQNQQYLTFRMYYKKNGNIGEGNIITFMNDKVEGWKWFK